MNTITIDSLPKANTIDPTQDYLPIYTSSSTATQGINRNIFLGISSAPVGLTDSQTITNKTLTSPTLTGPSMSGTVTGTYTLGGTPTFPSSVATLTGTQTLTNKTLTSPTINSPTITNATISADALTGYTTSNNGTFYGISVAGGIITTVGSVGSGANITNGVQGAALAANAITLGYAQITSTISTTSTAFADATGLTSTVTVPSGGRNVKVTFKGIMNNAAASSVWTVAIVKDGTVVDQMYYNQASAAFNFPLFWSYVDQSPSPGSHTYKIQYASDSSGHTLSLTAHASSSSVTTAGPAYILVEAI